MADIALYTYQDLLDHLTDLCGADASAEAYRDARRAIQSATRLFPAAHPWTFYYQRGRITTVAHYNAGTIAYANSTRIVTLSDGTFPSWSGSGVIVLNQVEYQVASYTDGTHIVLSSQSNPGADVDAGTTYDLYQDTYALPADLTSMDELINTSFVLALQYVHPNEWLSPHRLIYAPATPYRYTITGHPKYYGTLAVRFFPAPDSIYQMDFIYRRRPRPLVLDSQTAGTVSTTSGALTLTGVGTAFTSDMVGSVVRLSADGTNLPTGLVGTNPYYFERVLTAVASATSATLDSAAPATTSGVKYRISDPVDVEDGAMLTAFLRCCEFQMARARTFKDRGEYEAEYQRALTLAREADSRSSQRRAAGDRRPARMRLAYMPTGPDLG